MKPIRAIGFSTADAIAEKLGTERTAMFRVRAGISIALTGSMGDGHCGLPHGSMTGLTDKLLDVPTGLIESAMLLELAEGSVAADSLSDIECLFLTGLYRAERNIAEHPTRTCSGSMRWREISVDCALPWIEQNCAAINSLASYRLQKH